MRDFATFFVSFFCCFLTNIKIIKSNNLTEFSINNYTTVIFCQYFLYNYCLNEKFRLNRLVSIKRGNIFILFIRLTNFRYFHFII